MQAACQNQVRAGRGKAGAHGDLRWRSLRQFLRTKEREYFRQVLEMTNGDRARAAAVLGMSESDLNRKYPPED